jgi:TatD DNase family protein
VRKNMTQPELLPHIVDSHCHLNYPDFAEDLSAVLARAAAAGVRTMQTICTKIAEFEEVHRLALAHEALFCSVGVHPHESGKSPLTEVETLIAKAALPKVIGIGETGLDYYYEHSDRAIQQVSFRHHIHAAQAMGLPVIVHTRDADEDTVAILQEEMARVPFPFVIHCFTSSKWLADAALEMGGYISISGIITFKKAEALQETVRALPLDRLLIETDAPHLAPIPHRGTRNEPAYTAHVCAKVAALQGITVAECAAHTTENFFRLFAKAEQ